MGKSGRLENEVDWKMRVMRNQVDGGKWEYVVD